MKRIDWIKIILNLFVGFLTPILMLFVPVGGGGISLIFVITVPLSIGLSLLSTILYLWLLANEKTRIKDIPMITTIPINLLITFLMYPYA